MAKTESKKAPAKKAVAAKNIKVSGKDTAQQVSEMDLPEGNIVDGKVVDKPARIKRATSKKPVDIIGGRDAEFNTGIALKANTPDRSKSIGLSKTFKKNMANANITDPDVYRQFRNKKLKGFRKGSHKSMLQADRSDRYPNGR